jgi:N-acetylmuramoyl-L-alanine amidase
MRILIDAAHGGTHPGHVIDGLEEKDASLSLALALADKVPCILSRSEDDDVSHSARLAMARECDLTLSLHWHVSANKYLCQHEAMARTESGRQCAMYFLSALKGSTGWPAIYRRTQNRIAMAQSPVVILVAGYLSNPETMDLVRSGALIGDLASTLAVAIEDLRKA